MEPPTEHECQFKDVSFPHYLRTYTLNYCSVPTDIHKHYAIDGCLALYYWSLRSHPSQIAIPYNNHLFTRLFALRCISCINQVKYVDCSSCVAGKYLATEKKTWHVYCDLNGLFLGSQTQVPLNTYKYE